jgi:Flp pilus assembly protein TadD
VWHKPARQVITDSAYILTSAQRLREAAALLESWVVDHPRDAALLLDLARLRNSLGEGDAAIQRYREVLALGNDAVVRAELAATLLDGRHYDDAATEYRQLMAIQPARQEYRVGLARALLWGNHAHAAESWLRVLAHATPNDTSVVALLHEARGSYDPGVGEASDWVREEPVYAPYRLAFARALVGDGRPREAAAQFDTLLGMANAGGAAAQLALLREAAGVHATAGDSVGSALLLGRAIALAPENDSLRLNLARTLAWAGDTHGAIAQYSVLIAHRPLAKLLLTRGQLYVWRGDNALGAADLRRSIALDPSYEALALLGDVARWEGRFEEARSTYERALALVPNDARVMTALADLRRIEGLYVASVGGAAAGWTTTGTYAEDNLGFLFLAMGASAGAQMGDATVVGMGVEQRRIAQRAAHTRTQFVDGLAVDARARRQFGQHFALSAYGGLARHALVHDIGFGGVGADWSSGRISASISLGTGPVYGSLMSLATLAPGLATPSASAAPIVGRTATASVSVPLGRASLTVTGERLDLSDGNARNGVSAVVRVPVASNVAAIYDGSLMGYAHESALYWDPHRYATHSVGVEVTGQPTHGLKVAVRALPGVAVSEEPAAPTTGSASAFLPSKRAFQLSTGGEVQYQTGRWDASAGAGYARGREGTYQSLTGSIRVRMQW